jgi:iron complex outermembrane receptor protein
VCSSDLNVFALFGTKQDLWYAQASYTRNFQDHWDLPGDYTPVAGSAENGGARNFSRTKDWRVNVKLGSTPNATDEYSISYTRQEGSKNAPLHVTDPIATPLPAGAPNPRFWTWPYWNIESIYFLSTTALGDRATLKTRAYRNSFDNLLSSFNDATQTTQSIPRAFNSFYKDKAWGGSAQLDVDLSDADRFSLAAHYRRDKHAERQDGFYNPGAVAYSEPWQETVEDTYSLAAENRFAFTPALSLTLGVSYDWRDLKKAEEFTIPPARFFEYPIANADAFNWQGRLDWQPDDATGLHASVSRRARFPTIFERFSTKFGNAASNPALNPERSVNYEIGGSHDFGTLRAEAAVYYNDVQDAIVSVRPSNFPANTSQRRNLGNGEYYGGEVSLTWQPMASLQVGGNYSYIHRKFDIEAQAGVNVPVFALTDVPKHKGFAYISWSPVEALSIVPSVEIASDRTTLDTFVPGSPAGTVRYYDTGNYVRADLRIDYAILPQVTVGVGARNLFDEYYMLADGFPEQGRSMYLTLKARY